MPGHQDARAVDPDVRALSANLDRALEPRPTHGGLENHPADGPLDQHSLLEQVPDAQTQVALDEERGGKVRAAVMESEARDHERELALP